jgi:hypothetical protein
MNLKEIVNRPDNYVIDQSEALFVIKEYVKARKGVDIEPVINTTNGKIYTGMELQKMTEMATHAVGWFRANEC